MTGHFELHPRLAADTLLVGRLPLSLLLLLLLVLLLLCRRLAKGLLVPLGLGLLLNIL